jgi:hypothetical protein
MRISPVDSDCKGAQAWISIEFFKNLDVYVPAIEFKLAKNSEIYFDFKSNDPITRTIIANDLL